MLTATRTTLYQQSSKADGSAVTFGTVEPPYSPTVEVDAATYIELGHPERITVTIEAAA